MLWQAWKGGTDMEERARKFTNLIDVWNKPEKDLQT